MRAMVARIAFAITGLALLFCLTLEQAEGKSMTGFVITGGALGEDAAFVELPIPEGTYLPIGIPMSNLQAIGQPRQLPDLSYDLYGGGLDLSGGPDYRYYPEAGLLYDTNYDNWWEVLPQGMTLLAGPIDDALAKSARGELLRGVVPAYLRFAHMDQAGYWLRPVQTGALGAGALGADYSATLGCRECAYIPDPGNFAMRDLVATLESTPVVSDEVDRGPTFYLEFYGQVGSGGFGGLLGVYAPPDEGQSGRLWLAGRTTFDRFFETTPGFDDTAAQELRSVPPPAPDSSQQLGAAHTHSLPLGTISGAAAAVLLALGLSGAAAVSARRRRA